VAGSTHFNVHEHMCVGHDIPKERHFTLFH
jgi:hypothetical protein